jgi:hypothetical protein
MDRGRVGEDRGSKETDRCPLTASMFAIQNAANALVTESVSI